MQGVRKRRRTIRTSSFR